MNKRNSIPKDATDENRFKNSEKVETEGDNVIHDVKSNAGYKKGTYRGGNGSTDNIGEGVNENPIEPCIDDESDNGEPHGSSSTPDTDEGGGEKVEDGEKRKSKCQCL